MQRGAARIGLHLRHAVAPALDKLDDAFKRGVVRPRHAGWRHLTRAQLANEFLPDLAVLFELGEIQRVQIESSKRVWTTVAADTVELQCGAIVACCGWV